MTEKDKIDEDDVMQHREKNGIEFWVNTLTRQCGINVRGVARLCGVDSSTIRSALKKSQKIEGEVGEIRETELYNLLKGKDIFLEKVGEISPTKRGGAVKIILSNICSIFIRYYAGKGYTTSIESMGKILDLGMERFIFDGADFIPRPKSITLDDVEYLVAKEEIQVTKSRTGIVWFYTNPNTGASGIGLKSLPHLCGGVAFKHVLGYIEGREDKNQAFLRNGADAIVKSNISYATIYHFGYNASPRKAKAKEWATKLQQIDGYIHQKTGYAEPDRQVTDELIAAMRREIDLLRQQLGLYDEQGIARWHLLLGTTLNYKFGGSGAVIKSEVETTATPQRVDFVIENLHHYAKISQVLDGLNAEADHNIVTYKSHHQTLDANAINEHIGYYIGYKKGIEKLTDRDHSQDTYHLVAVCTRYPEALIKEAGTKWSQLKPGVYKINLLIDITVVVTSQVEMKPHNSAWLLFSHDKERVEYALNLPENAYIPDYIPKLLQEELQRK
ncbi:hypothetical protein TI05_04780 [Achromatium sp. WMS3]|nr:hypothetical protein TI05_04780 [Achromatium sp. WMS3]